MASLGLPADARALVLAEDVVVRREEEEDGSDSDGEAPALGLVFRVAGQSDDEALSDSGDDDVRAAAVMTRGCVAVVRTRRWRCERKH
jgi:hypothetical protein